MHGDTGREAVKRTTTPGSAYAAAEDGAVRKHWRGKTRVALVYPNRYAVGMSNLGLHDGLWPAQPLRRRGLRTGLPAGRRPSRGRPPDHASSPGSRSAAADIVAFSISFESDYPQPARAAGAGRAFRCAPPTETRATRW
ncbi:MAG: hypothetical protein MZV70_49800 [Desulfobacterales bacterium]|nr:hypothetical protein [Desulfobacterales bacterium]